MCGDGTRDGLLAGRYRLQERLGRGGVADVYGALDETLHRRVAVKIFRPGVGSELGEHRFAQEGETLARLQHPHLVTLYDAGVDAGQTYLVLQLVAGNALSDRLEDGPLPPAETARIGMALADALSCVHAHQVVHRDVKPSNVLLDGDGGVFLNDFGIARLADAPGVTTTGTLVGSAAYLSPEQVAGRTAGPAADVYALGLVLLECLTGRRVYRGGVVEVALARLVRPPPIPDDLDPEWQDLLAAMTAREPAGRPDARTVALRLWELMDDPPPPANDHGWLRQRRAEAVGACLVIVGLAAMLTVGWAVPVGPERSPEVPRSPQSTPSTAPAVPGQGGQEPAQQLPQRAAQSPGGAASAEQPDPSDADNGSPGNGKGKSKDKHKGKDKSR